MKTLILCVDRDDDLGEKAKVTSPVIGRKNNLRAVIALGIEDPEDSDANVIFMGLKLFKKYRDMGREVEIATICGDKMVGIQSDANLIRQFYATIEQFTPDTVVLVSDGAEDEVILPLISQRVQIEHIARVVVKQQQNLESTYYIIMSAFKNPKIGRKIIVPLALMFMMWGILMVLKETEIAIGLMITLLALFLMVKALNVEEQITRIFDESRDAMRTRRYLLFIGVVLSFTLVLSGVVYGYFSAMSEDEVELVRFVYTFLNSVWIWIVLAALSYTMGSALDTYVRTNRFIRSTWVILLSLAAIYFIASTAFNFIGFVGFGEEFEVTENLIYMFLGVFLLLLGGIVYTYNKSKGKGKRRTSWLR
jgi:putative membrane protein